VNSESKRLKLIQEQLAKLPPHSGVIHGFGDDTAVLKAPRASRLLFGSDMMVEGTHFDLTLSSPEDIGYKALVRCLSDIAATNGKPLYSLISLCLGPQTPGDFTERLYRGLTEAAAQFQTAIVGGDLTSSKNGIFIDVSVIGETAHPILRSGAKPGDLIALSGPLGEAAAGLAVLRLKEACTLTAAEQSILKKAYLRPQPRFDLIQLLCAEALELVTSMIDISDGLASELYHLSEAANAAFVINEKDLHITPALQKAANSLGADPYQWIYGGGDDYQLLVTLNAKQWQAAPQLHSRFHLIGKVESIGESAVWVIPKNSSTNDQAATTRQPLKRQGWDAFSN
jgi:thiamine-monophosphate kinase